MPQFNLHDVLNQALTTLYRSLPMFIGEVRPYTHSGDEKATQLLANIVGDQKHYSEKIAELILDLNGAPSPGQYPMIYTDLHLLSLDYLMTEVAEQQHRDVVTLAECAADAKNDQRARKLLEEVLGNARGHLESLEELVGQAAR